MMLTQAVTMYGEDEVDLTVDEEGCVDVRHVRGETQWKNVWDNIPKRRQEGLTREDGLIDSAIVNPMLERLRQKYPATLFIEPWIAEYLKSNRRVRVLDGRPEIPLDIEWYF